jgi:hypothetical protein
MGGANSRTPAETTGRKRQAGGGVVNKGLDGYDFLKNVS